MFRTNWSLQVGLRFIFALAVLLPLVFGFTGAGFAAGSPGAVYTLTNAAGGNQVAVYNRAADGSLAPAGAFSTGGLGSGSGLGSQGALVLSQDNQWLFAVNAGSNTVSVFQVMPGGLALRAQVGSGGSQPISLAANGSLLYVLNAGGSGNITGFVVQPDGSLAPLSGSTRPLSNAGVGAAPGPAQVAFNSTGDTLVVTEKGANRIDTYQVGADGRPSAPAVHASNGATPFGFAFDQRNRMVVSEAFGGAPGAGAVSSYFVAGDQFGSISASAPTHQTAPCWVVVTNNGKYAYTTNAGSDSISGYQIAPDGSLSLLNDDGRTGLTGAGSHPTDMALSINSQYLYALDNNTHAISAFGVGPDGSLAALPGASVPDGSVGLAAR